MSPADRETLAKKIGYLHGTLGELQPYQSLSREEFFREKVNLPIVERYLQTAIESVIDCARMLVTMLGWRKVREDVTDALLILARHRILSDDLAQRLVKAKGFRNVLVHMYAEVDPEQVYDHLRSGYADLVAFAKAMATWLQEHEADDRDG